MDHAIFHTPYDVELTLEERPTPPSYARYPEGAHLGPTMPMWRVQTEGYQDGNGQLIGIVARDAGFLDSPDAEWIASGANSKGPNAVALGRHGNFFHWGFAVSPTYMTEEAQLVLVNALHYIARYEGQAPIVRKVEGLALRSHVEHGLASITEEGYARLLALYADLREQKAKSDAEIRARIAAGEDVPVMERGALDAPPIQDPGRLDPVKRYVSAAAWSRLGEDPDAVATYLRENLPYLHPSGDWYGLEIDEELKRSGTGSDDPAFPARAVEALASDRAPLARTLLERYTTESFATPAEWNAWLEENRARLFFTEADGFKWMVITLADGPPAASRKSARDTQPTPDSPLDAKLSLERLDGGRILLTLDVEITDPWHAYDVVPKGEPYVPLTVELDLPTGLQRDGEWQRPASLPDPSNPALTRFAGTLRFQCELADEGLAGAAEVGCKIR